MLVLISSDDLAPITDVDNMRIDHYNNNNVGPDNLQKVGLNCGETSQPPRMMRDVESISAKGKEILDKVGIVNETPILERADIELGPIIIDQKFRRLHQNQLLILTQVHNLIQLSIYWWILNPRPTSHYDVPKLELSWAWQPTIDSSSPGHRIFKEAKICVLNGNLVDSTKAEVIREMLQYEGSYVINNEGHSGDLNML